VPVRAERRRRDEEHRLRLDERAQIRIDLGERLAHG
jgi:hypothetical protein